jgi:hypothetical protein
MPILVRLWVKSWRKLDNLIVDLVKKMIFKSRKRVHVKEEQVINPNKQTETTSVPNEKPEAEQNAIQVDFVEFFFRVFFFLKFSFFYFLDCTDSRGKFEQEAVHEL